jgi:hypothetical protein
MQTQKQPLENLQRIGALSAPYQFATCVAKVSYRRFVPMAVGRLWADCVEKLFLDRNTDC